MVSAVRGMGIDNVKVEIDGGEEPPVFDGSSFEYIKAISRVSPSIQEENKKELNIKNPIVVKDNDKYLAVLPYHEFKVHYFSDFSGNGLKPEEYSASITPESYINEIARARTFGFKNEIETLIKSGLIKGANLKNAVLIDKGKPVNTKLRYKNELTRHKILDIVGDFGLLGANLNLLVIAVKTGHTQNIEMARMIEKQVKN
jgi:UDP-3-O-[3-hydroxymyristoyl] N-acetylglucosamine deacetylase